MTLLSFFDDIHQIRLGQEKLLVESRNQSVILAEQANLLTSINSILIKIDKILDPPIVGIEVTPGATTTPPAP